MKRAAPPSYSIWFWGLLTSSLGVLFAFAPVWAAGLVFRLDVPPDALPWVRLFGLMWFAYSVGSLPPAHFRYLPFMQASAALRTPSVALLRRKHPTAVVVRFATSPA